MSAPYALRKVPEITFFFWFVKVLTTAFGESLSDYLVHTVNPIVAVLAGFVIFDFALFWQFKADRYNVWTYWFTVAMVAVFGTMAADIVHIALGVPYLVSTMFFLFALGIIFLLWYRVEDTLSIHSINTFRREIFYWLTVCATFALGTAAGDMTAFTLQLGFFESGILFAGLIAFVTLTHYLLHGFLGMEHRQLTRNAVFAFWLAYILTRPLGASFADWFGKAPAIGGLGWGDGVVSSLLGIMIVIAVGYLAVTKLDVERGPVLPVE